MSDFKYEKDADGIVAITMDMQGQSANTMSAAYLPAMSEAIEKLRAEQNLKGVVFASAKKTFFAGGDLNHLLKVEHLSARERNELRSFVDDLESKSRPKGGRQ